MARKSAQFLHSLFSSNALNGKDKKMKSLKRKKQALANIYTLMPCDLFNLQIKTNTHAHSILWIQSLIHSFFSLIFFSFFETFYEACKSNANDFSLFGIDIFFVSHSVFILMFFSTLHRFSNMLIPFFTFQEKYTRI